MDFIPQFDGIMGMGLSSLSSLHAEPVFQNMVNKHLVSLPVFSFYLNRDSSLTEGGELIIGEHNPKFPSINFTYVPVISNVKTNPGYWMFPMDRILVGLFMFMFHAFTFR